MKVAEVRILNLFKESVSISLQELFTNLPEASMQQSSSTSFHMQPLLFSSLEQVTLFLASPKLTKNEKNKLSRSILFK